ncbi:MAG: DNA-3-methyladenine glycosylase 2 family protein [Pseudomonadota bacterium]
MRLSLQRDAALVARDDPRLEPGLALVESFPFRVRGPGFSTLLQLILEQQVSVKAADAMWRKLNNVAQPLTPETFLDLTPDDLRACGFSRQKMRYGAGLANAIVGGEFAFDEVSDLPDEDAIIRLTDLKGIGTWTAECYLLFGLGRPDIMPAKDLALMIGWQMLAGLESRPSPDELYLAAEAWRPRRSAAAFLIWRYYVDRQRGRQLPG